MSWRPLAVLGLAQFLMVLDTSVMNVSISQLVDDFNTDVTAIQAAITLYTLVMAAFMITGGKLGDLWGRRRSFAAGMVVYGVGTVLTAAAPKLWVLILGWSIIEGLGAALVLPSLAALVGANYTGQARATAYGVIGGVAGAGIAVGPLLGGWVTTYLTWRLVFAGEAVLVVVILLLTPWIRDAAGASRRTRLDGVGAALSITGMALVVLGVLQSSTWGWLRPRDTPVEIFGLAPTLFVIAGGAALLAGFEAWERHREAVGREPLVRPELLAVPPVRAGLSMLFVQNFVLLGVFFAIPLYVQVVLGLDAFETGLRLLPASAAMLVAALGGASLAHRVGSRLIVRVALVLVVAAVLWLVSTVRPSLDNVQFALAMALLGIGMGLLASQLGYVVQGSVGETARGEVGGLQYTAQNLGSSFGTALVGAVLIASLTNTFTDRVTADPRISDTVEQQATVRISAGITFVSTDDLRAALARTTVPPAEQEAIVEGYADAQLRSLRVALLAAALFAAAGFLATRRLPTGPPSSVE
ncbi:MFS transporter [Asanoa iriomotensis]|uniref:MFS transporter n=1 Tax=Asanoa iriomotensis TaxID=234613 RepID=A0ABQ4C2U0_9ACTN|nr:MFS transporter [Asanoa iriomotensis]GIF56756.1 MFS transporter [Asanoa iriomotensis]